MIHPLDRGISVGRWLIARQGHQHVRLRLSTLFGPDELACGSQSGMIYPKHRHLPFGLVAWPRS